MSGHSADKARAVRNPYGGGRRLVVVENPMADTSPRRKVPLYWIWCQYNGTGML